MDNKLTHAESQRKYKQSIKGKETQKRYNISQAKRENSKIWQAANLYKHLAHQKVYIALKTGKLIKEDCVICGGFKTEAHHSDHYIPLDILWLCKKHHTEKHIERG